MRLVDHAMELLYFYGFASGPESNKAQFFNHKFSVLKPMIKFQIVDYIPDRESFINLKTSKLLKELKELVESIETDYLVLFGSSFGAFIALWLTILLPKRIKKLILMAPALKFSAKSITSILDVSESEWKSREKIFIDHYRFNKIPLNYSFFEDLKTRPPPNFYKINLYIPTLILHGRNDDVCPVEWSQRYAERNPHVELHILDSDHQLLNQKEEIWMFISKFLEI